MEEAINNGMSKDDIFYAKNHEDLLNLLKDFLTDGDTVLFKASNGMHLFDVVEKLK
jgi:UDP-N-acetylmuramyl pentapeptide synthase